MRLLFSFSIWPAACKPCDCYNIRQMSRLSFVAQTQKCSFSDVVPIFALRNAKVSKVRIFIVTLFMFSYTIKYSFASRTMSNMSCVQYGSCPKCFWRASVMPVPCSIGSNSSFPRFYISTWYKHKTFVHQFRLVP